MAPRHTTRSMREYGSWTVKQRKESSRRVWYVVHSRKGEIGPLGSRRAGRLRAQALAGALDSGGLSGMYIDEIDLPEENTVFKKGKPETWAEWASKSDPIPVKIASKGNPVIAGYLNGLHGHDPRKISHLMGLSEQTVSQYLSDLRAGRR